MSTDIKVVVWEKPDGYTAQVRKSTFNDDGTLLSRYYMDTNGDWVELRENCSIDIERAEHPVFMNKSSGGPVDKAVPTFQERVQALSDCGWTVQEMAAKLSKITDLLNDN